LLDYRVKLKQMKIEVKMNMVQFKFYQIFDRYKIYRENAENTPLNNGPKKIKGNPLGSVKRVGLKFISSFITTFC